MQSRISRAFSEIEVSLARLTAEHLRALLLADAMGPTDVDALEVGQRDCGGTNRQRRSATLPELGQVRGITPKRVKFADSASGRTTGSCAFETFEATSRLGRVGVWRDGVR
jgi:hypothetical protein